MPSRLRKSRKTRGARTHGYGRVGQHRDQGSKGFRKCGRHKHKWSWVQRYEPDYFGSSGFSSPKALKVKTNTVNIGRLDRMAESATVEKGGKLLVDLESLGFTKLLGSGKLTKPLVVKVLSCSKSAAEKVKEAGGQILMAAQEQGE